MIIIIIVFSANRRRKVQQRHSSTRWNRKLTMAPLAAAIQSMCDLGAQLTASWSQLYDDVCHGNSPKCILTRVLDFSSDGSDIILTAEEDNRLCRIANGDYGDDDDNENETAPPTAEDEGEVSLPIRLPGVILSGRRTTRFILR